METHPDYQPTYMNLAAVCYGQGRLDEAIELYRYLLRINPEEKVARENLEKLLQVKALMESPATSDSAPETPRQAR